MPDGGTLLELPHGRCRAAAAAKPAGDIGPGLGEALDAGLEAGVADFSLAPPAGGGAGGDEAVRQAALAEVGGRVSVCVCACVRACVRACECVVFDVHCVLCVRVCVWGGLLFRVYSFVGV
jgi:hypothetical protein